jgi:transposase
MSVKVVIGVDAHKKSHTLVALDGNGLKLAEKTVEATDAGHAKALRWALLKFGDAELTWGIEDCRHVSGRLECALMDAGQRAVRVPTRLMHRSRRSSRHQGKSDPIDAEAVGLVVLREPGLPVATHDAVSRELKLLVDRRDDLVVQRTATVNRLVWRIHELDPTRSPGLLNYPRYRDSLRDWLAGQSGIVAELALDELADITRLTADINAYEKRITHRVREVAPHLYAMPGCGALTAAKIMGETALVTRFTGEAAFAQHAGVAPLPHWSGSTAGNMRRPKYGNRQLNSAIHRIAITQLRLDGPGRAYYQKRRGEEDTGAMAVRALKRRICRRVYGHLREDYRCRQASATTPTDGDGVG